MAKNLAQRSRKWHKKIQIGENGGERKKNPSANPDCPLYILLKNILEDSGDSMISYT